MLAKILSEKELADMDIKKFKEDEVLLEELICKKYILVVDWSGEERLCQNWRRLFFITCC